MRITRLSLLLLTALTLTLPACHKGHDHTQEEDSTLDCKYLRVRKAILLPLANPTNRNFRVTIENTCKTCTDNWANLGIFLIDRTTNDTIAWTPCPNCSPGVKNNSTQDYLLASHLSRQPDLTNIRFDFSYLCH